MKQYLPNFKNKEYLLNTFSPKHFINSKGISNKDYGEICTKFVSYGIVFSTFLSIIMAITMLIYLIYGFVISYFFTGETYGYIKFATIILLFVLSLSFTLYSIFTNKIDISYKTRDFIQFIFEILIIFCIFLFFVSDCLDPQTSSSFSAGFIWLVVLSVMPTLSHLFWLLTSSFSITGVITLCLIFGQNQTFILQYYLIVAFVIVANFVTYCVLFRLSYTFYLEQESNKENQLMAETDSLTKIENRRGMEYFYNIKHKNWETSGSYITLIMFDIDCFKEYNDYFGHIAGDECLKTVTQIIKSAFKKISLDFFRFGGDEFIIFIVEPNLIYIEEFLIKILEAVNAAKIPNPPDSDNKYLSISIGASTVKASEKYSLEQHINEADKLLYKVKQNGKGYAIFNDHIIGKN